MNKKINKYLPYILGGVALVGVALIFVYRNKLKGVAKSTFGGQKWFDESLNWYRNNESRAKVETLHPKFKPLVKEFFSRIEKQLGLQMYATSGYRDYQKQAQLYAENNKNAKPGFSSHNFGFAVDALPMKNGVFVLNKASSDKAWRDSGIVKIAEEMGLKWGGGGNFGDYHDPIHFYIEPVSRDEMRALVSKGKVDNGGYVLV
jgi:hypothetical protein